MGSLRHSFVGSFAFTSGAPRHSLAFTPVGLGVVVMVRVPVGFLWRA